MAVYLYTAASAGSVGDVTRGLITADSPRQARDQLRARGLVVRDVSESRPVAGGLGLSRYLDRRLSGRVTGLLQELSTLLGAGIPVLEALDTIARQHKGRLKRSVMLLRDHVAAGGGLAEAMALQPGLFDELCRNIVEVGQSAGTLDVSLERLVMYRRKSAGLKNRVVSALTYPAIVSLVGVGVSIFLMTYVVPSLLGVLMDSGKPLPMATVVVKGVSDLLLGWWWLLLLAGLAVMAVAGWLGRTPWGAEALHRAQLRAPLVGDLVRKQAIARIALVMATLLKSDVVFVRSLQIAQRTVRNRVLRDALVACEHAVCAGRDISVAIERTDAFPPLVVQVFAVGQASGRLEELLENLARDYDAQVELASERLTSVLEPLMMILLAISVGFIAFATILPILEAGDVL